MSAAFRKWQWFKYLHLSQPHFKTDLYQKTQQDPSVKTLTNTARIQPNFFLHAPWQSWKLQRENSRNMSEGGSPLNWDNSNLIAVQGRLYTKEKIEPLNKTHPSKSVYGIWEQHYSPAIQQSQHPVSSVSRGRLMSSPAPSSRIRFKRISKCKPLNKIRIP